MDKYICIHGHFYQPPRENPWLEAIELQDSAYPYHDWNERVTHECYAPNGASRILDDEARIIDIVNNYSRMSFNVGPTLLSWLEEKEPEAYQSILDADKQSQERFGGHGSAMAQVYNHIIMPLALGRDKRTQIIWGLRDFEVRFGRKPEGMWLAEAAVDLESLDIMAEHGIRFTILAPHQARRFRKKGDASWWDVSGATIDPTRAYEITLPSGRTLALFFYDGPISRAVAFERLLDKGEYLVNRLMSGFSHQRDWAQIVHIATDGETYGHHHRYGDMALAFALRQIEKNPHIKLVNYAHYLELAPPQFQVEIYENSSWSCAHGIERWRSNCGCNSGMKAGWHQEWRGPLRVALDWLRDTLASLFEEKAKLYFRDPWAARNDYIDVVMDRSHDVVDLFLNKHATRSLTEAEKIIALKLMEIQRQTLLMYTSCGWFFDDLSGIETVQVIAYAGRAMQLAEQALGKNLEPEFLTRLSDAKSNVPDNSDGRRIYERYVKPSFMDLTNVGAHYAITSLFEEDIQDAKTYCYDVKYDDYKNFAAGKSRLVIGQLRVASEVTFEGEKLMFAILHLGDHNLTAGVKVSDAKVFAEFQKRAVSAFKKADFTDSIRAIDATFGASIFSLKTLFKDEQRKILTSILQGQLSDAEGVLRQVYEGNVPLMRYLSDISFPLPKALQAAAEFFLNLQLKRAFEEESLDQERIQQLITETREARVSLDKAGLAYALEKNLMRMVEDLWTDPADPGMLAVLGSAIELVRSLPFEVNVWHVQNNYFEIKKRIYPQLKKMAQNSDASALEWLKLFDALGEKLLVKFLTSNG